MRKRQALLAILTCALCAPAQANETAAFLKVGVGARPQGMGGAYTAVANDVTAMAWNPAGLGGLSRREVGIADAQLTNDMRLDFLAYAHPTARGTFGVAATRLSQGAIESRDAAGKLNGSYTAADTAISLSYGARLLSDVQLGGNLKMIESRVAEASAQTFAVDFGAIRQLAARGPGTPTVAFAIQNVGPGMRFLDEAAHLPLTGVAGLGYRLPVGLTLALDVKHRPYSHATEVSAGTEYSVFSNFALRGGYGSARNTGAAVNAGGAANLNGVAVGFGVRVNAYTLDYAITPFGELGNVQRFSLGARF